MMGPSLLLLAIGSFSVQNSVLVNVNEKTDLNSVRIFPKLDRLWYEWGFTHLLVCVCVGGGYACVCVWGGYAFVLPGAISPAILLSCMVPFAQFFCWFDPLQFLAILTCT